MRNRFRSHYAPTEADLAALWKDGLVVLDTNAILNLFRYTKSTREAFIAVLDAKQSSLWIPHQVGLEFHRHRHGVVFEQKAAFEKTINALSLIQKAASKQLAELHLSRHPLIDLKDLEAQLCANIETLQESIKEMQARHTDAEGLAEVEQTFQRISDLYDGRVGDPYSSDKLAEIYQDGANRYRKSTPPGYKDSEKGEPDMYGDLVIWMQLLDKGREDKCPVIFITDDGKDDWWLKVAGETKGPRPELVEEYFLESGQRIHFYSPQRFLAFASDSGVSVTEQVKTEVEKLSTARNIDRGIEDLAFMEGRIHSLKRLRDNLTLEMRALSDTTRGRAAQEAEARIAFDELQQSVQSYGERITALDREIQGLDVDDNGSAIDPRRLEDLLGERSLLARRLTFEEVQLGRARENLAIQRQGFDDAEFSRLRELESSLGSVEREIEEASYSAHHLRNLIHLRNRAIHNVDFI